MLVETRLRVWQFRTTLRGRAGAKAPCRTGWGLCESITINQPLPLPNLASLLPSRHFSSDITVCDTGSTRQMSLQEQRTNSHGFWDPGSVCSEVVTHNNYQSGAYRLHSFVSALDGSKRVILMCKLWPRGQEIPWHFKEHVVWIDPQRPSSIMSLY